MKKKIKKYEGVFVAAGWLEGLLDIAAKVQKERDTKKLAEYEWLPYLMGYISSAETILKYKHEKDTR